MFLCEPSMFMCLVYKTKCSEQSSDTIWGAFKNKLSSIHLCWEPSGFFCDQHFFLISFNTQHHNITSTQNKQNKTTDTYSTPQKSSQKEEREGGKKKKQNKSFLYIVMYVKEKKRKNIANAALQTDSRPEDGAIQSHILSMPLVLGHRK